MASASKIPTTLSLEEFLARRDLDEKPYPEFIDGRIEPKMSPQQEHGLIQVELARVLTSFARPRRLGLTFTELRCTFAGRSILPDVAFLCWPRLVFDANGRLVNLPTSAPDLHVEIRSPDQSRHDLRERLVHSTAHGTTLGWLIDPDRETVEVFRPNVDPETLPSDGILHGDPVLPGFALPVAAIWSWLRSGC